MKVVLFLVKYKEREFEVVEMTNMCAIVNENREVGIQCRVKSFKWLTFPGVHIEHAESIVMSTVRKIKEETGLNTSSLKFCGVKDWYDEELKKRYIYFYMSVLIFLINNLEYQKIHFV